MNETVHTIEDAARCLPDLVDRVKTHGEAALLVKFGQPMARLVPVVVGERQGEDLIAFLRQWRLEYPEPDDQFAEAIEEGRKAVQPAHDPWE
jgi:antitoxin (DNA-binding transcriptional repressor) of toxin-antitoxin stability system